MALLGGWRPRFKEWHGFLGKASFLSGAVPDLMVVVILLAAVLAFLAEPLFTSKVLLPADVLFLFPPWQASAAQFGVTIPHNHLISDAVLQNISWKNYARDALLSGNIPLWNPYIFAGMPFLAAGQYAVLYPLGVLFYLLPVAEAYGWFTALHLFLGGLFTYIYLRVIAVGRFGALVSAIALAFSAFLVVSFLWPMVVSTAIWLPLLLVFIELAVQEAERERSRPRRQLLWALLGALVVGMQFLAGHLEFSFYNLFTAGFYSLVRLAIMGWQKRKGWRILGTGLMLLGLVTLGTGLAAVQLLPFYELIKHNFRSGFTSYQETVGYALPPRQVFSFLMPDFFGNPTHHSYFDVVDWATVPVGDNALGQPTDPPHTIFWGTKNYVEGASYVGVLPLALALAAVLFRRSKYTLIFLGYAAFSLLLAFGSPLYGLFFYGIPGFDQLHTPFRWVYPYTVSVVVLAGIGADYLANRRSVSPRRLGWVFLALGAVLLAILAALLFYPRPALDLAAAALERSRRLQEAFATGQMLFSYEYRNVLLFALFLAGAGVLMALSQIHRRLPGRLERWRVWQPLMVLLLVVDLSALMRDFNTFADPQMLQFRPEATKFLASDRELFRVVSYGYEDVLSPNTGMLFGLQDARGYDTIIPGQYVRYWSLIEEPHGLPYSKIHKLVQPSSLDSRLLDLLNVKYVLTTQAIAKNNYILVYEGEGVRIYQNEDYLPRAFVVFAARAVRDDDEALREVRSASFDPRRYVVLEGAGADSDSRVAFSSLAEPAAILSYEPNRVRIQVDASRSGFLVLADSYFPGWRATVDGAEAPVYKADYNFRAVAVGAGQHLIEFRYSPLSFQLGLFTSFVAFLIVLMGFGYLAWQRFLYGLETAATVQRIVKNSLTPIATSLLNKAVDFGFAMLVLRLLGPENVGKYAFAVVAVGYFEILTNFGLNTLLAREVAKDRALGNRYLSNTTLLRLALCLVAAPVVLALVVLWQRFFHLGDDTVWAVALLAVALVPGNIATALSSLFYAHERMEYPAAVSVVTTMLKVSLGVGVLLVGWSFIGLAAVAVLVNIITAAIFAYLVMATFFRPRLEFDPRLAREMVGTSAPLMLNHLLATIFFRIDILLLQPMRGNSVVGYYSTAYKFVDGLNIIPSSFTFAIFPVISRYAQSAVDSLRHAYTLSLKYLLIISIPISVGMTLLAEPLVLLLGGEQYLPHSVIALQVIIWFLPFSYVNSVTQYVLIAINQQRFITISFVIATSFNIAANLLLIPLYSYTGAAIATILSEIVLLVPFMYCVWRHVGSVPLLGISIRPAVAGVVMGGIIGWLHALHPLLVVIIGGVVYLVALVALGTFDADDRAVAAKLLGRGPSPVRAASSALSGK